MAFSEGYSYLQNIFVETTIFNIEWVISLFLVFLTMLIITRETQKWKFLLLPTTVAWHIAGVTPSFLVYMGAVIFFMIEILSLETIGQTINVITGTARRKEIDQGVKNIQKEFEQAQTKHRKQEFGRIAGENKTLTEVVSLKTLRSNIEDSIRLAKGRKPKKPRKA